MIKRKSTSIHKLIPGPRRPVSVVTKWVGRPWGAVPGQGSGHGADGDQRGLPRCRRDPQSGTYLRLEMLDTLQSMSPVHPSVQFHRVITPPVICSYGALTASLCIGAGCPSLLPGWAYYSPSQPWSVFYYLHYQKIGRLSSLHPSRRMLSR